MAYVQNDPWREFDKYLSRVEEALKKYTSYQGFFEDGELVHIRCERFAPTLLRNALEPTQIEWLLSAEALCPPHALELLVPPAPEQVPRLNAFPYEMPIDLPRETRFEEWLSVLKGNRARVQARHAHLGSEIRVAEEKVTAKYNADVAFCDRIVAGCKESDGAAIKRLMLLTLSKHPLPVVLWSKVGFGLDSASRVAVCTIEVPDTTQLAFVTARGKAWKPLSETAAKRAAQTLLHALCVRAAYLVAMSDPGDCFDVVAVNANQHWFDRSTGQPREGIVASLQASKSELKQLQPGHLDADACFWHLRGIATATALQPSAIRPIFVLNTEDNRAIKNRDVASQLSEEANLAAMPWDDFEHLVGQLFGWLISSAGVEVKVTRASRDRGVDAIAFDPDPIRGGKYVIQAKRYTRTVDVAAVRDLYGTVVNEGANRGILVTTASYGPDSYEFAKDKPISLIDGPNLLVLLRKHGRNYRIDLEEARRLDAAT